jgi:hypothetical protein
LKYRIADLVAAASLINANFIDLTPRRLVDIGLIPLVSK